MYSYFTHVGNIARLCGYINDKRFVQPLIEVLNKPFDFKGSSTNWRESVHEKIIEALVRMRVEPYYTDYVKFRTKTLEQIKSEYPGFDIHSLVDVRRFN